MITLPNGLVICNCTPHKLNMAYEQKVFTVPIDYHVNAKPVNETVSINSHYQLVTVYFIPTEEGLNIISYLNETYPGAILLGSVVAAQAYPGKILAPTRLNSARYDKGNQIISSYKFTIFKENENAS